MKVYCENCKWYQPSTSINSIGDVLESCNVCTGTFDTYAAKKINSWKGYNPAVENFNNDCQMYSRKW